MCRPVHNNLIVGELLNKGAELYTSQILLDFVDLSTQRIGEWLIESVAFQGSGKMS